MNPDDGRLKTWLWPGLMLEAEDGAGAGTDDAGAQDAEQDASPSTTEVSDDSTPPAAADEVESPWRLEDVPEDLRPQAEALDRQWKAQFTRKTQELSQRAVDADVKALIDRLDDPDEDVAAEAMDALANRYGFEPNVPEAKQDGEERDEFSDLPDEVASELRANKKFREEQAQRVSQADKSEQVKLLRDHVDDGLQPLRERLGEGEKLPEHVIQTFTFHALANPLPNGLPDTDGAMAAITKIEADAVERFKAGLNRQPPPAVDGKSGVRDERPRSDAERRAKAEQVAERHYVRT